MLLTTAYIAQSQITLTRTEAIQIDLKLEICKQVREFNDSLQSVVLLYENTFDLLDERMQNLEKLNFTLQTNWERLQPEITTLQNQNTQLINDVGWYKQERDNLQIKQKKLKRRTWYIAAGCVLSGLIAGIIIK